jgi:hypothetical protein
VVPAVGEQHPTNIYKQRRNSKWLFHLALVSRMSTLK